MTEVIEVLALNRAKTALKIETLKNSKTQQEHTIAYLESLMKDYDKAIDLLQTYQQRHTQTETLKT